jgi:hypothetical protein
MMGMRRKVSRSIMIRTAVILGVVDCASASECEIDCECFCARMGRCVSRSYAYRQERHGDAVAISDVQLSKPSLPPACVYQSSLLGCEHLILNTFSPSGRHLQSYQWMPHSPSYLFLV